MKMEFNQALEADSAPQGASSTDNHSTAPADITIRPELPAELQDITIRPELPADAEALDTLVGEAFRTAHYTDGSEVAWVRSVRRSPSYVPELSFVLLSHGEPLGYILCSRCRYETDLGARDALVIAPLAIAPKAQGRRLGGLLLRHTMKAAADKGFSIALLEGYYAYYSRVGFERAADYGLKALDPTPGGNELLIHSTDDSPLTGICPGVVDIYNERKND